MPLPLGHAAIGLATYELSANRSAFKKWHRLVLIIILANLPDIDVVIGLFFRSDGNAFHRGPTHSLLFAVVMALLVWSANQRWFKIPGISCRYCFLLIISHVLADAWLTSTPVSFFWPLEVNWSTGHASLSDVVNSIIFTSIRDAWIVLVCGGAIILHRSLRSFRSDGPPLAKGVYGKHLAKRLRT